MDIGIVIDSSSSVRRDNYEKVKAFIIQLAGKLHISNRMSHLAVIHYNHRAFLDWDFKSDRAKNPAALKEAILHLRYHPGGTRTDKALEKSKEEMFTVKHGLRPDVPHVLFVLTDGKTSSRSKPYREVLKPFKVNMYSNLHTHFSSNRVLKCDVIKMKFPKLWDLSGYSERTMSKRPTCQKGAFRGKFSLRS